MTIKLQNVPTTNLTSLKVKVKDCFRLAINGIRWPMILLGSYGNGKTEILIYLCSKLIEYFKTTDHAEKSPQQLILIKPSEMETIDVAQYVVDGKKLVSIKSELIPFDIPVCIILDEAMDIKKIDSAFWFALIREQKIHGHSLHKNSIVLCTGNTAEHNSGAGKIQSNGLDRMTVLHFLQTANEWIENFANENQLSKSIIDFVELQLAIGVDVIADGWDTKDFAGGCTARSITRLAERIDAGCAIDLQDCIGDLGLRIGNQFFSYLSFQKRYNLNLISIIDGNEIMPAGLDCQLIIGNLLISLLGEKSDNKKISDTLQLLDSAISKSLIESYVKECNKNGAVNYLQTV